MKYVATFLVLFSVWVLLAGTELYELAVGGVVSIILAVILSNLVSFTIDFKFPIRLLVFVFAYIPVFIYQLVLANLDVAYRVLSPKIPLNPGIVKVPSDLEGDFAKLTLANSITLTPGTLTIDVVDGDFYIHTVNVKGQTPEENKKNISSAFERLLGGIFK